MRAYLVCIDSSGMFHSDDERIRNVDPYNESWQPYSTTTTTTTATNRTTADKRNADCTFEFGQFDSCDVGTFGFDFDYDLGGGRDSNVSSQWYDTISTSFSDEFQRTTFGHEDKWPI